MRRLIFLAMASVLAFSCDAPKRSSEEGAGTELEERSPDPAEEADIHSDTTTSGGMNRQNQYDTLK